MKQAMLTCAIPFPRKNADAVDEALANLVPELRKGGAIRKALREQGLHFMTITVVRGDTGENTHLVFEINADDEVQDICAFVERTLAQWLKPLFQTAGIETGPSISALLAKHSIRIGNGLLGTAGINFCGTPGLSVARIRAESTLARAVRDYFDAHPIGHEEPLSTVHRVRDHIAGDPKLKALLSPAPPLSAKPPSAPRSLPALIGFGVLTFLWPVLLLFAILLAGATAAAFCAAGYTVGILVLLVGALVAILAVAGLTLGLYCALRALEETNTANDDLPDPHVLAEVIRYENWSMQNHLAGISVMQAGLARRLVLRLAFWVIGQMVAHKFRPGFLGELSTIHFARWVLLPGTNKLLFFSNYGGSWESYLEDFITRASTGLTAVWSNTRGFPRTRNLFMDGATDGDRFKRWARRQQQPTRFWYSAYPNLTTARIRANAAIRQGLGSASTQEEAASWLALFGSQPRPDAHIDTADVQTLLFGGLSRHPFAACLALRLPDDTVRAREWLRAVAPQITFGDQPPRKSGADSRSRSGRPRKARACRRDPCGLSHGLYHGHGASRPREHSFRYGGRQAGRLALGRTRAGG
jgi:hypothetical protein